MLAPLLTASCCFILVLRAGAQMNTVQPSTDVFLPVINVGSNDSGTSVPFYGCSDNGATLQSLSLWANDQWIRGLQANLTDGRQVLYGCLNVTGNETGNGCSDPNIRNSTFTFQKGERLVQLTLWPGYNQQGVGNSRAGALNFSTSLGRSFDFGMTASRQNASSIKVGDGIPCGIAPKAGADIDALGFIFLRSVTQKSLTDVQYSGVSEGNNSPIAGEVAPLSESANIVVLSNQTYNNTGQSTGLVATSSSQSDLLVSSQWTSSPGIDSYLLAPVYSPVPEITEDSSASNISWQLTQSSSHSRNESLQTQEAWNYTVNVGPQGVSRVVASVVQGNITATFTATLNVTLDSGAVISVPLSGIYQGLSESPVSVNVVELAAAVPQASRTNGNGGKSNTVAWVVGVLAGLVAGLLLAALLAWAIVLIMRKRNKRNQQPGTDKQGPSSWPYIPGFNIPVFAGKGTAGKGGFDEKDIELGKSPDKEGFYMDKTGKPPSPAMGVPISEASKEGRDLQPQAGELPEAEGKHVMPYNLFRRLRLDSIRQKIGDNTSTPRHGNDQGTPVSRMGAQIDELQNKELSNPPSEASTPRTIPEASRNESQDDTLAGGIAERHPTSPEPDTFSGGPVMEDEKIALRDDRDDYRPVEKNAKTNAQRKQLREQVALKMAQGRKTPERPARAPTIGDLPADPVNPVAKGFLTKVRTSAARLGTSAARFKPLSMGRPSTPTYGFDKETASKSLPFEDSNLKLGAGYKSAASSKTLEKNTVDHDDAKLKLGVKYHTQGRND